jgi:hypothetical protein
MGGRALGGRWVGDGAGDAAAVGRWVGRWVGGVPFAGASAGDGMRGEPRGVLFSFFEVLYIQMVLREV